METTNITANVQDSTPVSGGNPTSTEGTVLNPADVITQPATTTQSTQPFKAFQDQAAYDREAANIRRAAEKKIFDALGISEGDKEKLTQIAATYKNSLSDSEKLQGELKLLREQLTNVESLKFQQEATIAALFAMNPLNKADVEMVVNMARGLVTEQTPIDQAIQQVMAWRGNQGQQPLNTSAQPATLPKGMTLQNPVATLPVEGNPFEKGKENYTEQARLFKNDPEKAKRLAKEAGSNIFDDM